MTAGYSKTPLAKKLGLKDGMTARIMNEPKPYPSFFRIFPEKIEFLSEPTKEETDFIHIFVTDLKDIEQLVASVKPYLKKSGLMWVSWPKGSSKIKTDVKREPLRSCVLKLGLVDVKVCAIDEDWSGLKFVYRLKDR